MNNAKHNYSDADLIQRYLELRDYIQREQDALDERLKPYHEGMQAIENEFLARLNARVPDETSKANSATDFGTAFRTRRMTPKVVDQSAFLQFCFDQWDVGGSEMFKVSPLIGSEDKPTPLREWMEENTDPETKEMKFPPGLEVSRKIGVNIRKV